MARVQFQHVLEMRDGSVFVLRVLLEGFSKSEMSIDRIRVDLDGVFEVLGCTLPLTEVRKQVSQMDACAEVILVQRQAFLKILHTLLEVFQFFVTHASIVEGV